MKNSRKLLIFIVFLCLPAPALTQVNDQEVNNGIDHIYRLQFDSANTIFQSFVDRDPKDPTGYFFLAMSDWWKIYLNKEDRSNDESYLSRVDRCIKVCEERLDENENDDWATFLLGGVIGYRGFMNVMRDNWLKAIDDGKQGLNLVQKSYEMNPSNKDAALGLGIYNYAVDYVVQRYPFLKAVLFFFPKGNKELGILQLKDCAENGRFSRTEANAVLAYVHLSYEKNYIEAEKYSSKLVSMYPQNTMFELFLGKCLVGQNRYNEGAVLYSGVLAKADSNLPGYNNNYIRREANYYLGLSYARSYNHDGAIKHYEEAINLCRITDKPGEESAYFVFSALGLGLIHDMKGNKSEAIRYFDMVLGMKNIDNSHESAQRYKDNIPK